jgi:molybdopterin molybdotransferase
MQFVNPVLPESGFAVERLLPPGQAMVAYFARVAVTPPAIERVALEDALGRFLAEEIHADADYPSTARSLMDGFAVRAAETPGEFTIEETVRMGDAPSRTLSAGCVAPIPTGGALPPGADAVVPIEDARVTGETVIIKSAASPGENVGERGGDMRRGERVLAARRRIRAPEIGVLATLGVTAVPVYRRPVVAVLSSGDELVDVAERPGPGEIRDSNRYAAAASLRAMGAQPRHYPILRDEAAEFELALRRAIDECDAVAVTGGSSVGERDRLPHAVAAIARPGVVVHGLRVKPGKPTLLGADGGKPILGLPGNPTSALMMLEAVAAPIVGALVGGCVLPAAVPARLAEAVRSRAGWTWYIPVALEEDGGLLRAHPLTLRSFSVSLTARADGYIVMDERDDEWPPGKDVTVIKFLEGCAA